MGWLTIAKDTWRSLGLLASQRQRILSWSRTSGCRHSLDLPRFAQAVLRWTVALDSERGTLPECRAGGHVRDSCHVTPSQVVGYNPAVARFTRAWIETPSPRKQRTLRAGRPLHAGVDGNELVRGVFKRRPH